MWGHRPARRNSATGCRSATAVLGPRRGTEEVDADAADVRGQNAWVDYSARHIRAGKGSGGPGFQFANEYPTDEADDTAMAQPALYPKGSIAMANAGEDTNGSQFFINYKDSQLPPAYTYFGNLTEKGQKTIDAIAAKGVKDGQSDGEPAEEVRITKATIES